MIDSIDQLEPIGKSDHILLSWTLYYYTDRQTTTKQSSNQGNYAQIRSDLQKKSWNILTNGAVLQEQITEVGAREHTIQGYRHQTKPKLCG